MAKFEIGPASPEERIWAAQLMMVSEPWITLRVTDEQCMNACHHPEHRVFIAHDGNLPAGMIIVHPNGLAGSPYIKSICVRDSFRGKGLGREMVMFIEDFFRRNSRNIFLCVSSFNLRAQEFYNQIGYQRVGEFQNYMIKGASEILLHKSLR